MNKIENIMSDQDFKDLAQKWNDWETKSVFHEEKSNVFTKVLK